MKKILQSVFSKWSSKSSIDRLNTDDLRRREILLRNQERKLQTEIEGIEKAKQQLFEEARCKDVSDRQRMQAARNIERLEIRLKELDHQMHRISKEQRIAEGLLRIKQQKTDTKVGGIQVLVDVDPNDIRDSIEKELVNQQIAAEKAAQIIELLDQDIYTDVSSTVSESQQAIYEQICQAAEVHHDGPARETEDGKQESNREEKKSQWEPKQSASGQWI
jgi:hypothetical protein